MVAVKINFGPFCSFFVWLVHSIANFCHRISHLTSANFIWNHRLNVPTYFFVFFFWFQYFEIKHLLILNRVENKKNTQTIDRIVICQVPFKVDTMQMKSRVIFFQFSMYFRRQKCQMMKL